ncbi:MAG: sugar ABC transporter ATP-binding protein [Lachnospiraceae bacterium]|nr:sugar ABC transporter ATP-binding protein [Lachnospiraceae bacterium]
MEENRLELIGINKTFTAVKALDTADFFLKRGEVHGLLGINGAGKSTLIKIISGIYSKDSGEILMDGKPVVIKNAQDAIALGISTVYQDPQMIDSFTGYENIYLGMENESKSDISPISRKKMRDEAKKLLEQYPLDIDLEKPVSLLSAIEREIIALLRAIARKCDILILDEPTSILTEKEKQILFDCIRELKGKGVSIIYITHHLDEVSTICDSYTIFRNGKTVASENVIGGKVDVNHIAELMIGEKLSRFYPEKNASPADEAFSCEGISLSEKLNDIGFSARKGEILGIFGLVGSGIDELSKIMYGAMDYSEGSLKIAGEFVKLKNTESAIEHGIYLVPGNRKTEGQIGNLSIAENITLAKLSRVLDKLGLVKRSEEQKLSGELINTLSIATPDGYKKVQELSGGNQQKVVIGKGLFSQAKVYVFCEPTVGVDVGAKSGIYEIMRGLAKDSAVIILSSDPEEVLGNADRIIVLNQGRITLQCADKETTLKQMLVKATSNQ